MSSSSSIRYQSHLHSSNPLHFQGFFVDWPTAPAAEDLVKILRAASHFYLALDHERVVGFVTAISDGVLSAYIPLLEVLPVYQGRGIGRELMQRMLRDLESLYMVDLCCDPELKPYYERLGAQALQGMGWRHYGALKQLPDEKSNAGRNSEKFEA